MYKKITTIEEIFNSYSSTHQSDNPTTVHTEIEENVIKTDVPLMIRLLEYAREDAKNDLDLHIVAKKMIELSEKGETLTMENYSDIVKS